MLILTTSILVGLMVQVSPPARVTDAHLASENGETYEQRVARYGDIATDILGAVNAPEAPALFAGEDARAKTALMLLEITRAESDGWHWSVDRGARRGDGGHSYCIGQVYVPPGAHTPQGWTGEELMADRSKCLAAALLYAATARRMCLSSPEPDRLSAYVSGSCDKALDTARSRYAHFQNLLRQVELGTASR